MKLKTWEDLKVGDKVTVRTVEEMKSLKGAEVGSFVIYLPDEKTEFEKFYYGTTLLHSMSNFCSNTYTISEVTSTHLHFCGDELGWSFTRKMLRNEVIKK
ncbi:MAG: hypothetical protein ACRCZZ_05870 [Phocaeicola sp.]